MRPRDDLAREFASLVVWWALWSLWDEYLLDFTPLFELTFLGALGAYHGARRLRERRALAPSAVVDGVAQRGRRRAPVPLRPRRRAEAPPLRRAFLGLERYHEPRAHGERERVRKQKIHKRGVCPQPTGATPRPRNGPRAAGCFREKRPSSRE